MQDETGDKRLRRGMGEIYKGPLHWIKKKEKTGTGIGMGELHGHEAAGAHSATN